MDKIGVFLCTGCGIGDGIDTDAVIEAANERGCAHTLTHECFCAPEGLQAINGAVAENGLDGLLIAACSERAKTREFNTLTEDGPSMFRVALRDHCTWSHEAGHEDTTMLAQDLVRMGLARIEGIKSIEPLQEEINDTVMVVGSGRAGLEAALTAAGLGKPVAIIELDNRLGGILADQLSIAPEEPPYDAPVANPVPKLIEEISGNDQIKVYTNTSIKAITGQPGQFKVELHGPEDVELTVGSIVQATGAKPYDANNLGHLGYGKSADVVTSHEFEAMLASGKISCPSDNRTPQRIAFIQCAGSRDENHLKYCSSECCTNTLRQIAEVQKIEPSIESAVIHKDIRTPGHMEYFYLNVQSQAKMLMTRGEIKKVEANGKVSITSAKACLVTTWRSKPIWWCWQLGWCRRRPTASSSENSSTRAIRPRTPKARRFVRPRRPGPRSSSNTRAPKSSISIIARDRICRPSSTGSPTRTSFVSPTKPGVPVSMLPAPSTLRWIPSSPPRMVSARR